MAEVAWTIPYTGLVQGWLPVHSNLRAYLQRMVEVAYPRDRLSVVKRMVDTV